MIVELLDTTTSAVSRELVRIRDEGGVLALSRALTLVISCRLGKEGEAIDAANEASQEHPMRVIVLAADVENAKQSPRLDAEIRVGSDAGASEVVILKAYGEVADDQETLITGLLLPDVPVVAWWPDQMPDSSSDTTIGRIAHRRITDASNDRHPLVALNRVAENYVPGNTDISWTRLTNWRAQLAAVLDQPPFEPILHAKVVGATSSPSTRLLASWLELQLKVNVDLVTDEDEEALQTGGLHSVTLSRSSGDILLRRFTGESHAVLQQPGHPDHELALPRRSLRDCLSEELRRLDADELFGRVVTRQLIRGQN